jgi:hypothetical protein
MLMDTVREKQIKLGTTYPFEALKSGECLIGQNQQKKLNLSIGDKMVV